ncbi:sensor histidine kinase [Lacticaseibacillus mingshuiensis]|uniref:histidine kinase n=1 Tax=Lacticaseibacillus mingshuiensis TaxID=2799574 RepID=A0ABW4CFR3_9LACO|nr:HAMP domain-containing sensor histidine kinase [Lacticaseibacillus mingshuiensis]
MSQAPETQAAETTAQARKPRRKRNRQRTSASRMTWTYIWLLAVIMVVTSFATIGLVGYHLIRSKRDDSILMMSTLKSATSTNEPDWQKWHNSTPANTRRAFVKVTMTDDAGEETYFSRGTQHFLKNDLDEWPLSSHVQYEPDQGLYYHSEATERRGTVTIHYQIWQSLNPMVNLLRLLVTTILGITLIGLVLGIWLIGLLARRLNQPLVQLTEAANSIVSAKDVTYHETLPVPDNPVEVHALSIEFNRLLNSLNRQVIRDHQFVSDASHELRTPLTAIRGHLSLIRRHGEAHPELVPQSLEVIDTESLRMQHLIESLLQLSRMDHATLALALFDVTRLMQGLVAAQPPAGQRVTFQGALGVIAYANADTVEQIVSALISNARKYSPEDSTIEVLLQESGQHVFITVTDTGEGVPEAEKKRIFDRFYRVDAARSKEVAGTGLGLAIANRMTALNHGQLTVSDNQPRGSRFTLTLPAGKPLSEKKSDNI